MDWSRSSNTLNPDVSVIIPTFNRISMLKEAIASIIAQVFEGVIEIIVVDDNSEDGTSEFIRQNYPYIRLISLKENIGAYAARNRGLLIAKGRYMTFLDSDDLWQPNYLKTQMAALAGKERCFCVSALIVWDTVTNQKKVRPQKPNLVRFTSPLHALLVSCGCFISTPSSVFFPRQVFKEVGLFDEEFRVGGDNDLYTRCLIAGYQPVFTELPTVICRKHGKDQLTNPKNLRLRKRGRLKRVRKLSALIEQRADLGSVRRIQAEIHASFASRYLQEKYFLQWLASSMASAYSASPQYALRNIVRDIKRSLRTRAEQSLQVLNHE